MSIACKTSDQLTGQRIGEFMRYPSKSAQQIYNEYQFYRGTMSYIGSDTPLFQTGDQTWFTGEQLLNKLKTDWNYLIELTTKIYSEFGYIIYFFGNEAKILHEDVYRSKVFGNKILDYYSDSIYNADRTAIENVYELCEKFIMHKTADNV